MFLKMRSADRQIPREKRSGKWLLYTIPKVWKTANPKILLILNKAYLYMI